MLKLIVGNKNYSSWSMRPWVLLRQLGIAFEEQFVSLNDPHFAGVVGAFSPALRVPVLVDGGFAVWDSIAIFEYVAERFPDHAVWPADPRRRARARSVCAEMHAGFAALRSHWPMNLRADLPGHPGDAAVQRDTERICAIWTSALTESGGPFLFGAFSAADAMYAPVAARFVTYHVDLAPGLGAYRDRLLATDAVRQWTEGALAETEFIAEDEPYASPPGRP